MKKFKFDKTKSKLNDVQVCTSLLRKGAQIKTKSGHIVRFTNVKGIADEEGFFRESVFVRMPLENMSNKMSGYLSFLTNYRDGVAILTYGKDNMLEKSFVGGTAKRSSVTTGDFTNGKYYRKAKEKLNARQAQQQKYPTSNGGHMRTIPGSMKKPN